MSVVLPRRPISGLMDAFYDTEDAFFNSARIVDWTLVRTEQSDVHPYDEFAYVLEGALVIESGGQSVELRSGDAGMVRAHSIGTYRAPEYARVISIGGPNPQHAPSIYFGSRLLDGSTPPIGRDASQSAIEVRAAPPVVLQRGMAMGAPGVFRFESGLAGSESLRLSEVLATSQHHVWAKNWAVFVYVVGGTLLLRADNGMHSAGAGVMLYIPSGQAVEVWAPEAARLLVVDCANLEAPSMPPRAQGLTR